MLCGAPNLLFVAEIENVDVASSIAKIKKVLSAGVKLHSGNDFTAVAIGKGRLFFLPTDLCVLFLYFISAEVKLALAVNSCRIEKY